MKKKQLVTEKNGEMFIDIDAMLNIGDCPVQDVQDQESEVMWFRKNKDTGKLEQGEPNL